MQCGKGNIKLRMKRHSCSVLAAIATEADDDAAKYRRLFVIYEPTIRYEHRPTIYDATTYNILPWSVVDARSQASVVDSTV